MNTLTFLPLYDRIIVRPADEHGKTASGLYIPEVAKANKLIGRGEVIAVGGGRITMEGRVAPLMCRVGDLAIYAKQQAQPIPWGPDEEEVHVLREPEILGVYRAEEAVSDLATVPAERGVATHDSEVISADDWAAGRRFPDGPKEPERS